VIAEPLWDPLRVTVTPDRAIPPAFTVPLME
jgi:hypothetical protein